MRLSKLFITIIILLCSITTLKAQKERKPNIIYILADDLGLGDVGAFNSEGKILTPNLDKLAKEGMMFTDAHTSSSICTPTRYGIITGRYNWRSKLKKGVLGGTSPALIPNDRTTIASLLKSKDYETALIGKWHLGWSWARNEKNTGLGKFNFFKPVTNSPNDLGFDYFYAISASLDMAPYIYVENNKPTSRAVNVTENLENYTFWRKGLTAEDFNHQKVLPNFVNRAIKFVKSKNKNNPKPFFLYLPLPSPHTPILPTKEFQGKSGINPYGDFVMMVDSYIGKLLDTIKEQGLEDNTMIVFVSDNGCSPKANVKVLKKHGHDPSAGFRGMKASIYEGGHRVPFIVKWPGVVKPNSSSNQTICTTDFLATCAEIVNYKLADNEGEDSYSILPLLKGEKLEGDLREATVHHSSFGYFAIRKENWKLILCEGAGGKKDSEKKVNCSIAKFQLFNLKDDPSETKNVYNQYPDKYKELRDLLIKYIKNGRSTSGKNQKNDSINFEWEQIKCFTE